MESSTAHRYGGDGDDVVLVGHSQGGYVGTMVALAGDKLRLADSTREPLLERISDPSRMPEKRQPSSNSQLPESERLPWELEVGN